MTISLKIREFERAHSTLTAEVAERHDQQPLTAAEQDVETAFDSLLNHSCVTWPEVLQKMRFLFSQVIARVDDGDQLERLFNVVAADVEIMLVSK